MGVEPSDPGLATPARGDAAARHQAMLAVAADDPGRSADPETTAGDGALSSTLHRVLDVVGLAGDGLVALATVALDRLPLPRTAPERHLTLVPGRAAQGGVRGG